MKELKKIAAIAMALAFVLSVLAGCSGKTSTTSEPAAPAAAASGTVEMVGSSEAAAAEVTEDTKFKKEIIIASDEAVNTMDPAGSTSVANLIIFWMSHSTLIDIDPLTGEITCDLCESYEQKSDVLYEFKLRQGVKFHNGEELTADDVKFTFERARESTYISDRTEWIKEITVVDPYTVQIELTAPAQDMLFHFSYSALSIVNRKAVEEDPDFGTKIGTGPYVITDFEFNNYTILDRFEDYFGEKPHTERFNIKVMPEAATRLVALQTGDVDICVDPAAIELDHILNDPNLQLISGNSETTQYLALNVTKDIFKDQKVRQAIAYGIDKESVLAVAVEGHGTVCKTFFSSGWGQATDLEGYTYDPDKAKALLAEAGVTGLEFTLYACDEVKKLAAQVIQDNLKDIGITVHVEEIERSALKPLMVEGNFDAALYNWANDSAGPDNNVRPILRTGVGGNRSHFSDPYIDDLMDKAMVEGDPDQRLAMYHEIQEYVLDQAPIIPLYYEINYVAAKKGLANFKCDPSACHRYAYCYIVED
ncbi:MAG: ABC transporter substrate-binding protein [Clostridia bacterium]|nr:ABC transporter substrate-binding protein [Clostridia bacterium]